MFNRKVFGALAKVVALLLLVQAVLVIIMSAMTYAGTPVNLQPSITQAIALVQQLGSIAFLYVVLGAAYRLASKKKCAGMKCQLCPKCGKCMDDCSCSKPSSSSSSSAAKKTTTRKSTARKTTKKKSTSRSKK